MKQVFALLSLSACLSPVSAQEVAAPELMQRAIEPDSLHGVIFDSLQTASPIDTVSATIDSIEAEIDTVQWGIEHDSVEVEMELKRLAKELAVADSLARIDHCPLTKQALMRLLSTNHKWKELPYTVLYKAAEQMEVEGSGPEVKRLLKEVDAIPFDPQLVYAQSDIRLPLFIDNEAPQNEPSFVEYLTQKAEEEKTGYYENLFSRQLKYGAMRRNYLNKYAVNHLDQVTLMRGGDNALDFSRKTIERKEFETTDLVITDAALDLNSASLDVEQVTFHADKWHRYGSTSLQMAQTALSSNWYKGGDNNTTLSTYDKLKFSRYDESMKTTLDIAFELRLSGYYTAADTVNSVRVNDNQLRMDVSYGYKAWKNWYYSTTFYAKTPIFDFREANSRVTKSTFLAPLETNIGVGLDYKKQSADKRFTFNMMYAPLSYSLTAVCSDRVEVTQYGLEEGEKVLHQFGSSITSNFVWKISDLVTWTSRFYYFTTYKKIQVEFENNFDFQLGKYCNAKFYYYPRFDDSRDSRVECKQMLTFGLAWVW